MNVLHAEDHEQKINYIPSSISSKSGHFGAISLPVISLFMQPTSGYKELKKNTSQLTAEPFLQVSYVGVWLGTCSPAA